MHRVTLASVSIITRHTCGIVLALVVQTRQANFVLTIFTHVTTGTLAKVAPCFKHALTSILARVHRSAIVDHLTAILSKVALITIFANVVIGAERSALTISARLQVVAYVNLALTLESSVSGQAFAYVSARDWNAPFGVGQTAAGLGP